ncbi:hypothetical protein CWS02_15950 [Enterobacter sp. EA-1]|nr:hypothetical protein CWS02_15950 [Enterobacter sp. EA-1]
MSGIVTVGTGVTHLPTWAIAGTMVDSCGHCDECNAGNEQYCENQLFILMAPRQTLNSTPGGITVFQTV